MDSYTIKTNYYYTLAGRTVTHIQDEHLQVRRSINKGNHRKNIIIQSFNRNTQEFEVEESARYNWCIDHLQNVSDFFEIY